MRKRTGAGSQRTTETAPGSAAAPTRIVVALRPKAMAVARGAAMLVAAVDVELPVSRNLSLVSPFLNLHNDSGYIERSPSILAKSIGHASVAHVVFSCVKAFLCS